MKPNNGEIDILEGVNQLTQNAMSLHATYNCTIAGDLTSETGSVQGHDCTYYRPGNSEGCGVQDARNSSYGTGFNAIGGGLYAMQWTSDYIRVWFFQRGEIPADITNLTPDPASWGLPAANLQGSCDIDTHFQQHSIVFDNTFCGSYAGQASVWDSPVDSCKATTGYETCNEFVAAQPAAFQNSYWSINSVRVYQLQAPGGSVSSSPYIASLQLTASIASISTSTTSIASPTANLCPNYNYDVVQNGNFQYEIVCGHNPPGGDLGPPYQDYSVTKFEDCVAGCTYWNTHNGTSMCGGVTYGFSSNACYWKTSISSMPVDSNYNGARLIYYGYPKVTDDPRVATASTTTMTTPFVSTPVTPQVYSNPNVSNTGRTLSTASGTLPSNSFAGGMGGSASTTWSSLSSSSTIVITLTKPISSTSQSTPHPAPTSTSTAMPSTVTSTNSTLSHSASISSLLPTNSIVRTTTASTVATSSDAQSSSMRKSSTAHSVASSALVSSSIGQILTSHTVPSSSSISSSIAHTSSTVVSSSVLSTHSLVAIPPLSSSVSIIATPVSSLNIFYTTLNGGDHLLPTSSLLGSSIILPISISKTASTSSTYYTTPTAMSTIITTKSLGSLVTFAVSSTSFPPVIIAENPASVKHFAYGGCQGSDDSFAGFQQVETGDMLSIESCISDCFNQAFAGMFDGTCYCSNDTSVASHFVFHSDAQCDLPCPGRPTESCGGSAGVAGKRDLLPGQLLTIYKNTILLGWQAGSATSSNASASALLISSTLQSIQLSTEVPPTVSTTSTSTSRTSPRFSKSGTVILHLNDSTLTTPSPTPSQSINLNPTVITTIYIDLCDTCAGGLGPHTTIITMMHCGCTASVNPEGSTVPVPPPTVPMTTIVKTCTCGENDTPSSTTVTIPCTSQIEEMSSSMAEMVNTPAPAPAPEAVAAQPPTAKANPALALTASAANSADVPEMTNNGILLTANNGSGNNGGGEYAMTKTCTLQSALESGNATVLMISLPSCTRMAPEATDTKKSEGGIGRVIGVYGGVLLGWGFVMCLL